MKSKLIAVLTTGMMLTSAVSTPPVIAAEQIAPAEAVASIPDWIPKDLESAVDFLNTYGATHIGGQSESDLLCVVFQEPNYSTKKYEIKRTAGLVTVFYNDVFVDEDTDTAYEVMTYKNVATSKPDFKVQFSCDSEVQKEYSFTSFGTQVIETDIYSWLPDCEKEYWDYAKENEHLSVKDNYVVFCLSHDAGTAYDWTQKDKGTECFKLETVSDCSPLSAVPLDGGQINTIYAYKAVSDGYDKISYYFGEVYSNDYEEKKPLVADCAVLDDAQTVLLSGDMRVTLVDYDTGEQLTIPEGAIPRIWTDVRQSTPDGEIVCNMQPPGLINNPGIVRLGDLFDGYNFSFGLVGDNLPIDYSLPDTEDRSAGYYNGAIVPEDYITVKKYDNGTADVVFRLKKEQSIPEKDTIRFKLIDADNGKTLCLDDYGYPFGLSAAINYYLEGQALPYFISKEFSIDSNPYSLDLSSEVSSGLKFDKISRLDISLYAVPGSCNVITGGTPKTVYDNNSMDVIVPIRFTPTGDVNSDGNFSISDLVSLQKWLLGDPDITFADWKAADFFNDDKLDIFDLILMRKELVYHNSRAFIFPDEYVGYSTPIIVREDGLKLYLGPEESFDCIAAIPARTRLRELGYMKNEDNWLYTEYNGQNGWIKTVEEDGSTPTIYYEEVAAKPVIYLYPEEETDVHVELELTEAELSTTYPKYNNGWDVTASPDGSLTNKADGTHHKYLFWDAVNCRTRFDFSEGFCVAGKDTESFLKEKLTYIGLTEEEMNEFIVYWLPLMEHNAYNLISFQGAAYTDSAKLNITPTPDSLLRVFMAYVPLEEAVDIQPQQLETFERKGFTVVEWGGSEIRS